MDKLSAPLKPGEVKQEPWSCMWLLPWSGVRGHILAKSFSWSKATPPFQVAELGLLSRFWFSSLGPKVVNKTHLLTNCFALSRCFAALGNMAKAQFLHETSIIADQAAQEHVSQTFSVRSSYFPLACIHNCLLCPCSSVSCYRPVLSCVETVYIILHPYLPGPSSG